MVAWRSIATDADRDRLRDWRRDWSVALPEAQADGGAQAIAGDPALFDPDRAQQGPIPPAGTYQCRWYKLGSAGVPASSPGFVSYPYFQCSVGADGRFAKLTGSQRPMGRIYPDQPDHRAVFIGTLELSDERAPLPYGRDRTRDMIGYVERIGPQRWRLVLPSPRFESRLDIIELVPA